MHFPLDPRFSGAQGEFRNFGADEMRVTIKSILGDVTQKGQARPYPDREIKRHPDLIDWFVVKFDDGGSNAVHRDNLMPVRFEQQRRMIAEDAERMCVPGWATPRWKQLFAGKGEPRA